MATADQIKALIRSFSEADGERFFSVAMQVAAQEARNGHTRLADEIRKAVDEARARTKAAPATPALRPVPLVQPRGELAGLLAVDYPKNRFADMVLDQRVSDQLGRVLLEQRQQGRLFVHGFSPLRKLLLLGPPGTGKTMTAAALAGELSLPLFTIRLDGLITKFMGETAVKMRVIFDAIQQTRAVYLFDEIDALAGDRGARNDVGEIRRVLNSFLQFLERDDSPSLIVGATNHVQLLDRALFRRFDSIIEYTLPPIDLAEQVMRNRLAALDASGVSWKEAAVVCEGLSHAEIVRACERAAKDSILAEGTAITTRRLVDALEDRRRAQR